MNNKIFLYILLICFIIIQGCVIRQEIHFNKNFSGTYKFTFDYSKLSAFSKKNDSLKSSEQDISSTFKERVKELEKISGLSEITYLAEKQEGKVYLSYKFINTEVLNKSLKHSSSLDMKTGAEGAPSFNLKGKKLSYYRPEFNLNADTLKGVLENMFRYEFIVSFERKIKNFKLKSGNAIIKDDKHTVIEEGDMFDIAKNKTDWVVKF